MAKKALITGITGQDGSYLAEFLLEKGYEVHGMVRRSSTINRGRIDHIFLPQPLKGGVPLLHYGDLTDASSINRLLRQVRPDEIYNLGAQSHVKISFEVPEYTGDADGLGTLRILEGIRESGIIPRFYQAGSSEMFGKVLEVPQTETTPFYPRSPYAAAKVYAHWLAINFREAYGMFVCNGILFNHESPRRGENFVTRKITLGVAAIKLGLRDKLTLGNLEAKRDWGYARDYVEAMWLMLQQDQPDDYVIATGECHTVREFCELAFARAGLDYKKYVVIDPMYMRPTEVDLLLGDASKAKQKLGWQVKTDFQTLVNMMVDSDLQALAKTAAQPLRKIAMFSEITQCRICGNANLLPLLDLGEQYLTGVFPAVADAPLTRGPLQLVRCAGEACCGLVQLRHTYNTSEMYGENYGYRSSLNQAMVEHLREINAALQSRVPLQPDDTVLDIGSNDGTLLSFYPENGLQLVGMDPTAGRFRAYYRADARVVADFFSAAAFFKETGGRRAKIVTSIAMFYDLPNPLAFMQQVAEVMAEDGIWHFEQSYMPTMLHANSYDTVCHEHLEYYTLKQIAWMISRSGLKIVDVLRTDTNGGSFAVTAAKRESAHRANGRAIDEMLEEESAAGLDTQLPYDAFAGRVARHRTELRQFLNKLKFERKTVLGYGASTKGNVILQYCGLTAQDLPAIAEVNKDKFGRFTPGTRIPIISETEAHQRKPDYFLVLPWHFRQNLLEREATYLRQGGKMIFPLPKIEIVSK